MKPELSELRKWLQTLLKKQNRARLALVLGCIAMALILLSELFPAKAPAAPQAVSPEEGTYKTQLEQQLTELIEQVQGAGKTTVMLTLESGEETVYALDTLSGQTQSQQTHVLLEDGTALEETTICPRSAAWPSSARAAETSGWQPASPSWWLPCWMCPPTVSA